MVESDIDWLSTEDTARRLGLTTRTIYRFVDIGGLPAYRFGRVFRFKASDVDAFIEQSRVEPGTLKHLYPDPIPAQAPSAGEEESSPES
ncbi:MAG: helix-turn-helix domain-containing protein [bacterium]|nr:helix-turn-helix domain-containing protein [bacterium]